MIHLLINSIYGTGSLLHSLLPKKNLHLAQQPAVRVALHFAMVCHALNKAISRSFQHQFHHLMHEHFIFMNDHDFSFFLIQMFICMYHIKASTTSHKTKFSTVSNNSRRKKNICIFIWKARQHAYVVVRAAVRDLKQCLG